MSKREKVFNNLLEEMESLYRTGEYYVSVPSGCMSKMGGQYWGKIIDPDGNVRDRKKEKRKQVQEVQYIIDFVEQLDPGRILDIGCGPGWLLSSLSDSWVKFGIEMDKRAIDISDESKTDFFCGDFLDRKHNSGFFDVIIMHHVIEHMRDPQKNIEKAKAELKKNGILVLGTPDFDSGCARLFGPNYRLLHDPTHISLFSNDSMHRFLRDHGFHILKVEYPYFQTRFFNEKNLKRLLNTSTISPPFYGNFMTFFTENS